ncbi:MAG: thiamine pyrophosphate-dependent dehydrogenase E1 component subunit alpha [Armatimonadetes bacterium]|nr:thiamine pyrophosphate-dependent dehydrogenase E1 component subunit alpha [Armatimonadota bacterium]
MSKTATKTNRRRPRKISPEIKRELLWTMVKIRHFEETAKSLYMDGVMRGTLHLSTGQEAVAAGACLSIRKDDYITSTHRGHGHCIAKGVDIQELMAEILGRATGMCNGRGGTMHVFDVACGVMGTIGVVGGGVPVATGLGVGVQQLGTDRVVLCFLGDGASNEGAFHEAVNLGSAWKLPVVYIIENNLVGDTTPLKEVVNIEHLADRAASYGIPGVIVDGNDVMAVYQTVGEAASRARAGDGPTLIECKTYRWEGHHLGDPCVYRTKEEVNEWKLRCPLIRMKNAMVDEGILSEVEWEKMNRDAAAVIEDAVAFAKASPEPAPATVTDYVL